jgi:hypothetical protein
MTTTTDPDPAPRDPEATAEVVAPPDAAAADDWDHDEMPNRPLRRRIGPLTATLSALVLAAAAFAGGVVVEKRSLPASSAASFSRAAPTATRTTGAGSTAGFGAGAAPTVGTVTLIDGANVYITEADGTIVKVATNPQSQVTVASPATTANIKPGDSVTVTGATGADGTITATSVRDTGASGGAGRGGGQGGASRPGGGGAASTAPAG